MTDSTRKPLRLWPGVVIVVLQFLLRFVAPAIVPGAMIIGVLAGPFGAIAILIWWLFFSRAPWSERLAAPVVMIAGLLVASRLVDKSIATGAMGMLFPMLAVPVVGAALVIWAVAAQRLSTGMRRATMVATLLLACGFWTLARTGGFSGSFHNDLHWRWEKTPEEKLLAQSRNEPPIVQPVHVAVENPEKPTIPQAPAEQAVKAPDIQVLAKSVSEPPLPVSIPAKSESGSVWPGFRGPHRDSVISGVRIKTDWSQSPPVALWKRPIGPGWSSFAVRGDLIYTQEQRGPEEFVSCYRLSTGQPVWTHRDPARFWESNGGAGPRGTPTLHGGGVYTFGGTGILNALDAGTGAVLWSRNPATDNHTATPMWGFAGSPLVVDDEVIVASAGQLAAYDLATGAPRWTGPAHGASYSSPQLATLAGVPQVLLLSQSGITSVGLPDGKLLWEQSWKGYPIVQPALTADGDVLMSVSDSSGIRRLAVSHGSGGWTTEERWTSTGLKPYFNDFVVHDGHAFGFDGSILSCIDLKDGKRLWKGGRYGNGQLVLLPDQNMLLVLSEEGDIALVGATPDQFKEYAHAPAIEGKTWNHPVMVRDVLLVRNGQEMAAFRLAQADR